MSKEEAITTMTNLYEKFKNLNDPHVAYTTFNQTCSNNDLETVKFLTKSEEYKNLVHPHLGSGFVNACISNHLELVRYFLTEPGLTTNVPISFGDNDGLIWAAKKGNLSIVKYLLTSPELTQKANINARSDESLFIALRTSQIEVVDYLLNSSELQTHSSIDSAFKHVLNLQDRIIFEEITSLTASDFSQDEKLFMMVYQNKSLDAVNYLIFNRNIPKTSVIEKILQFLPKEKISQMFEIREINDRLENELPTMTKSGNKFKI